MNDSSLPRQYIEILIKNAQAKGIDWAALFDDEPKQGLSRRRTRWNNYQLGVVSKKLKMVLQDEFWGMGESRVPSGSFRFACELCALSDTLEEALTRAFRLFELTTDTVTFRLTSADGVASVTMALAGEMTEGSGLLYEWWLWLWHFIAQWMIGAEIPVIQVDFPHPPIGDAEDYDATFGANWRFRRDHAQISFPAWSLQRRIIRTVADVEQMHTKTAVSLSFSPDVDLSLKTMVASALAAHLKQNGVMPTLEALAGEYDVCGQTLRRRLQREGTSYRAIKAEVRTDAARRCIGQEGATISDAAARAGFAEANGLVRAIRAWTGLTASEFRRAVMEGG
jgi:AraC-like DNA-binding protein